MKVLTDPNFVPSHAETPKWYEEMLRPAHGAAVPGETLTLDYLNSVLTEMESSHLTRLNWQLVLLGWSRKRRLKWMRRKQPNNH